MERTSEFTGAPVDTYSDEWRHECECKTLLRMVDADARNAYLTKIERRRGAEAATRLRVDAAALFLLRNPEKVWEWYRASFEATVGLGPVFAHQVMKRARACKEARAQAAENAE